MRAAEAVFGQHGVGIAGEIAIGEEQKLDVRDEVLRCLATPVSPHASIAVRRDLGAARATVFGLCQPC